MLCFNVDLNDCFHTSRSFLVYIQYFFFNSVEKDYIMDLNRKICAGLEASTLQMCVNMSKFLLF